MLLLSTFKSYTGIKSSLSISSCAYSLVKTCLYNYKLGNELPIIMHNDQETESILAEVSVSCSDIDAK